MTINSFVEFLNSAPNKGCLTISSKFKPANMAEFKETQNLRKAGQNGDEVSARAYVALHTNIYTDLNGNVQFDLINDMLYGGRSVGSTNWNLLGTVGKMKLQNYFNLCFRKDRDNLDEEEFEEELRDLLFN